MKEAEQPLFTSSRDSMLQLASDKGLPSGVPKRGSPFIFFSLGPTRFDFFALGFPQEDKEKLSAAIDQALKLAYGKELAVSFANEKGLWVFDTDDNTSGYFKTSASSKLDIPAFRQELGRHGYRPLILLRTPTHASEVGTGERVHSTSRWVYFDATEFEAVQVSEAIEIWDRIGLLFFACWPFATLLVGFHLAIRRGQDQSLPLEERKQRYTSTIWKSLGIAIGLHFPIFLWFYSAGRLALISDLWFGTARGQSMFAALLLLFTVALVPMFKKLQPLEAELNGTTVEAMNEMGKRLNAYRRPGYLVGMAITMIGCLLGFYVIEVLRQPRFGISILLVFALVGLISMSVVDYMKSRRRAPEPSEKES